MPQINGLGIVTGNAIKGTANSNTISTHTGKSHKSNKKAQKKNASVAHMVQEGGEKRSLFRMSNTNNTEMHVKNIGSGSISAQQQSPMLMQGVGQPASFGKEQTQAASSHTDKNGNSVFRQNSDNFNSKNSSNYYTVIN